MKDLKILIWQRDPLPLKQQFSVGTSYADVTAATDAKDLAQWQEQKANTEANKEGNKVFGYKTIVMTDPNLIAELDQYGVKEYRAESEKSWISNFIWYFGPVLLLAFLWFFMIKQMNASGKSAMSFGKSKSKENMI